MVDNDGLILDTFQELKDAIQELNEWWMGKSVNCIAYGLPVLSEASVPDEFAVERLSGESAVRASADAFEQFSLLENQGSGTVLRVPGCIVVDDDDVSAVLDVNTLKDTLRMQIAEATPAGGREREKLCRRLFRSCSMSQIYRHIVTVPDKPVVALSFTWNRGAVSILKMERDDAYSLLKQRMNDEIGRGNTKAATAIEMANQTIAGMPQNAVVWKRKNVAPHPCANLVFRRGGKSKGQRRMVKANLPIILPLSCNQVDIGALANFNMNGRRPTRVDKKALVPLFPAMGLFSEAVR